MHGKRILTAAVLGPLVFAVLWWGGAGLFGLFLLTASAICLYEYFTLCFQGVRYVLIPGVVTGLLPVFSAFFWKTPGSLVSGCYGALLCSTVFFIFSYRSWQNALEKWTVFFMGAAYVGFCAAHMVLMREMPGGREWILFLLVTVFSGDAGAYYVGKGIGRRKLCPALSSGKTVEGAVGGVLLNLAAALVLWSVLFRHLDLRLLLFLAVAMGIVGQAGDLAESIIKRSAGIKDSGTLLPGHGGIFDRVDAVLLAAPLLYWGLKLAGLEQG